MTGLEGMGKLLLFAGGAMLLLGALVFVVSKFPGVPLIGRLPGDIFIRRDGFSFYFPLATSILLSILLTVIINIAGRFLK